jgi:hypothetical protein
VTGIALWKRKAGEPKQLPATGGAGTELIPSRLIEAELPISPTLTKQGKKNPPPLPPNAVKTKSPSKFADAELNSSGMFTKAASTETLKSEPTLRLASARERPSLHVAEVVPKVVMPPHVALVLIVVADAKPTANVRERTYRNIGFLLSG